MWLVLQKAGDFPVGKLPAFLLQLRFYSFPRPFHTTIFTT